MSEVSLARAEILHRRIGEASLALGLRARYLGALAFPLREGLEPATRPGVWQVVRPDRAAALNESGLELAGEALFRISVTPDPSPGTAKRWQVEVEGVTAQLTILDVTRAGRALLEPFKARLGAG